MNRYLFAPIVTRLDLSVENQILELGEPIRVWGIRLENNLTPGGFIPQIVVRDIVGNFTYIFQALRNNSHHYYNMNFIADSGIRVNVVIGRNDSLAAIIFHSHPGT